VETCAGRKSRPEVTSEQDSGTLAGNFSIVIFWIVGGAKRRFDRLLIIGMSRCGWDNVVASPWEIFRSLAE
jgi:hypothetical protein